MKRKLFGLLIITISFMFMFFETSYFGNNLLPESLTEFICDLLGVVGVFTGFIMIKFK